MSNDVGDSSSIEKLLEIQFTSYVNELQHQGG